MIQTDRFEKVELRSAQELHAWLMAHHRQRESVWLVTWKKKPAAPHISTSDVLDALIAFGWIDGVRRKLDDDRTMQLISPRKQQAWAQSYKDRAARLQAAGRMHPAGQAVIEAAKAAGQWDAALAVDALQLPDDLAAALRLDPQAASYFNGCAPSYRRNVLRWLHAAKRPETRVSRIVRIIDSARQARKLPQL